MRHYGARTPRQYVSLHEVQARIQHPDGAQYFPHKLPDDLLKSYSCGNQTVLWVPAHGGICGASLPLGDGHADGSGRFVDRGWRGGLQQEWRLRRSLALTKPAQRARDKAI